VVVDGRPLDIPFLRAQGIGRYAHGLLSELPAVAAERGDEVTVLRAAPRRRARAPDAPSFAAPEVPTRFVRRPPVGLRFADLPEQVLAPADFRRARADVAHALSIYRAPLLPAVPLVLTVHDLVPLRWPEQYLRTGVVHRMLYAAARRARRVLCPSRAVGEDVVARLHVPAERVDVVSEGVDARFSPEAAALDARRPTPGPYVLCVGGLADDDPRKDLGGLIDAFGAWARAGDRPETLVLAGRLGDAAPTLRRRAEAAGAPIVFTDFVDEHDLPGLYRGARCLVSATRYEGFGLPMLEAIACGTPVAAYAVGALPEVCGPGADLGSAGDGSALMAAVQRLCDDAEHRARLVAAGVEHARAFTWRRTAELTWNAYERAAP
jgi:glycosyltransferase involved in cell wall biosynthesis